MMTNLSIQNILKTIVTWWRIPDWEQQVYIKAEEGCRMTEWLHYGNKNIENFSTSLTLTETLNTKERTK